MDSSDRNFRFLPDQSVQKATNRVVPKMGTKVVDLSRLAAVSTTPLTPVRRQGILGRNSDGGLCCQDVHGGCVDGGEGLVSKSNSGFDGGRSPGGVYHSDSERSGVSNRLSLHRLRDWNSDGDARPSPGSSDFPSPAAADPSPSSPVDAAAAEARDGDDKDKADFLRLMYERYAHVMYTNKANLHHTIMVQQKLFEQQIVAGQNNRSGGGGEERGDSSGSAGHTSKPHPSTMWFPSDRSAAAQAEWVIRRRGDGSRYITRRRPARGDREDRPAADGGKVVSVVDGKRCTGTGTAMEDGDRVAGEKVEAKEIRRRRRRHLEKAANPRWRTGDAAESDPSRDPDAVQPRKLKARKSQKNQGMTFEELLIRHFNVTDSEPKTKTEKPLLSVVTI